MPRRRSNALSNRLPPINAQVGGSLTARYGGNLNVGVSVTSIAVNSKDLLAAPGVMAVTTNSAYLIAAAIKVKRVRCWLAPMSVASGVASIPYSSISVNWYNSAGQSSTREITDSSLSLTAPACVSTVPERNSLCSFWINTSGSGNVFEINVTGNNSNLTLMIDVEMDYVLSNQTIGPSSITTASSLTPGTMYYTPLDGVSSHTFYRVGLPVTF
jgi:hypothetical protein